MNMQIKDEAGPDDASAEEHALDDDFFDVTQPREGRFVILALLACLVVFVLFSCTTKLDEVTRAEGRVIPSSNTQSIQSSEPGIVSEMLVRAGESVEAGQVLVRLDDTLSTSDLGQLEAQSRALQAQAARLQIEYEGGTVEEYVCPEDVMLTDPSLCRTERNLLEARVAAQADRWTIAEQRLIQRERQLSEANSNIATYREGANNAQRQLDLIRPMAETGVIPQTQLIETENALSQQRGLLAASRQAAQGAQAAVTEAEATLSEVTTGYREEVLLTLNDINEEISVINETLRGAANRVARTEIRSPVNGTVNSISVTTLGAFVQPGEEILSVVPRDDILLVEARVRPSDIAFIRAGQEANVKITAYDATIYGGLDAEVIYVAGDSVYDRERDENYFIVQLETNQAYLESRNGSQYPITPGMITSAEIITGRKTISQYLLKPVTRAFGEALRER